MSEAGCTTPPQPLLVIVGPTASGKTSVGIEVALRLSGEIISADSMQVYRGMDIGTGKATAAERARVPHHLLDIVEPDHPFTVAEFQARADLAIREIAARGRLPLLVGGTGLYVRAVVDGLDFAPRPSDLRLRRELERRAAAVGPVALHAELAQLDPETARRVHPHDVRRVVRALEVYRLTGRPISAQGRRPPRYDALIFGLHVARAELYRRIERRVDEMLAAGWVDEVRRLIAAGFGRWVTSAQALGYRELAAYLRGEVGYAAARAHIVAATRRFAKRQLTWFRADPRIRWLNATDRDERAAVPGTIVAAVQGKRWEL